MNVGVQKYFYVEMYGSEGLIYRAFGTLEDHVFTYDKDIHFSKYFGVLLEDEVKKFDLENWKTGERREISKKEGSQVYKKIMIYLGDDLEKIMNEHKEISDLIDGYIEYKIQND